MVDSETAKNPKGAIAVLKELRLRGERLADLEWTRLTGWRQALANVFDDAPMEIAEARVGYGGAMSTGILYFLALDGTRRAWRASRDRTGFGRSRGIRTIALSGKGGNVTLVAGENGLVEVCCGERTSHLLLPSADLDSVMRAELSISGPDAVFEAVLK